MKTKFLLFNLLVLAIVGCNNVVENTYFEIEMNNGWTCKFEGDSNQYPCQIPTNGISQLSEMGIIDTVLTDSLLLFANQYLSKIRTYTLHFDVPAEVLKQDSVFLIFEGIADCTDIFLNSVKVTQTNNMFLTYKIMCKNLLTEFNNVLEVHTLKQIFSEKIYATIRPNDTRCRKAMFLAGTDLNPPLPFCGIWKPVSLTAWSKAHIESCTFTTVKLTKSEAQLELKVNIKSTFEKKLNLTVKLNSQVMGSFPVSLKVGDNVQKLHFTVSNPDLWWCNGLGNPVLQNAQLILNDNGKEISVKNTRFGIRKIELVEQTDSIGYNFFFKLNNLPIFIKGGTLVPLYYTNQQKKYEVYNFLLENARLANFNMIRVWAGGLYESESFYNLCDEKGLLVWQDLPFSCNKLQSKDINLYNINQELNQNIGRIAKHPSASILFCNPEIEPSSGFEDEVYLNLHKVSKAACNSFFTDEIPEIISNTSQIPYYSGCISDTSLYNSQNLVRDWRIWYGSSPISDYFDIRGGFFSEYGVKSISYSTPGVQYYIKLKDEETDPEAYAKKTELFTNNLFRKSKLLPDYLQMYYNDPYDFESMVILSQVFQGQALLNAVNSHIIHKPFCMGTLFWHLNETYPGVGWSVIDYNLNFKPAWYSVKKAFKPISVVPERLNGDIRIWAVNDSLGNYSGNCQVELIDFSQNKKLYHNKFAVNLLHEQSQILWLANEENIVLPNLTNKVVLHITLLDNIGNISDESFLYFTDPKYLDLPVADVTYTSEQVSGGYWLHFTTNSFAKNVIWHTQNNDIQFSDNNLDMLPGRVYNVFTNFNGKSSALEKELKITTLFDTY